MMDNHEFIKPNKDGSLTFKGNDPNLPPTKVVIKNEHIDHSKLPPGWSQTASGWVYRQPGTETIFNNALIEWEEK